MALKFQQQNNSSLVKYEIVESPDFNTLIAPCIAHDRYVLLRCEDTAYGTEVSLQEAYSDQRRAEAALDDWMRVAGGSVWFELLYPMN